MDSQTGIQENTATNETPAQENAPGDEFESRQPVGEELLRLLILNLEYLFSRDYLSQDPLLVSQLDAELNIPFKLIEEHPLIKALSSDSKIILKALTSSEHISVDLNRQVAKPADKPVMRNTIILRDIPKTDTVEEEIRALFNSAPTLLSDVKEMKAEVGNTFFIKFATEEVTLEAWKHLRNQTYKDQPVQARIKSENLTRSSYYLDPSVAQHYQQQSAHTTNPYTQNPYKGYHSYGDGENGYRGRGRFNNRGGGGRRGGKEYAAGQAPVGTGGSSDPASRGGAGGRGRSYGKRGQSQPGGQGKGGRPNQNVSLAQWWPPLPSGEADNLTSGYSTEFKKYSKDQIVSIIGGIQEKTAPVWNVQNSESIREGEPLTANDLIKPLPRDAKVEWVENRGGRRPSTNAGAKPPTLQNQGGSGTQPQHPPAATTGKPTTEQPQQPTNKWVSLLQNQNDKKP